MARRALPRRQALHATATAAAWIILIEILVSIALGETGGDAHAYWRAEGYGRVADTTDAFLYTPPFLLALQPLQLLPWEVFRVLWLAGQATVLVWLAGPILAAALLMPGSYSPVYVDLWYGNLMVLSAGVVVAGFRKPYWLGALPFGKLLPGVAVIGAPWRVWGAIAGITVATILVAPDLWPAWADALRASAASPPENGLAGVLFPRLLAAGAFIGLWRMRGWRSCVPVAVMLAQPVLWFSSLAILVAWIPLVREHRHRAAHEGAADRVLHPVAVTGDEPIAIPVRPDAPAPLAGTPR